MSTPAHEMSNAEKRALKAKAQSLEPVVKLGHAGLSEAFVRSMDSALLILILILFLLSKRSAQRHGGGLRLRLGIRLRDEAERR